MYLNAQLALVLLKVKFISYMYNTGVSNSMVGITISAISKYHITDRYTSLTVGKDPLVERAKKAFWQLKPPLPKY